MEEGRHKVLVRKLELGELIAYRLREGIKILGYQGSEVIERLLGCDRHIGERPGGGARENIEQERSLVEKIEIEVFLCIDIPLFPAVPRDRGVESVFQVFDIALGVALRYLEPFADIHDADAAVLLNALIDEHDPFELAHT